MDSKPKPKYKPIKSYYDCCYDNIYYHIKKPVIVEEHDYDSNLMLNYYNKQKMKKKNNKKE